MLSSESLDFLRPVKSEEFLPSISWWTTVGGIAMVSVFGVGVGLAATTPYTTTVKAPARVRPTGENRVVQVAIAGTVEQILVKEGEQIQPGREIARLDPSQVQTKRQQLAQSIQTIQQQQMQVAAQMRALEQQIFAESSLMQRTIAASRADLSRTQRDYQERRITIQTQVEEAEATLDLAQTELQKYRQLTRLGAVAELQVKEKEQAFKAAQARLQRAKAGLNPSNAPILIAAEQIQQHQAKGDSTLAVLEKEKEKLKQQQLDLQQQRDRDQKELQQLQHDARQTTATAPIGGKILKLALRNPGQVVQVGETIAQIAPTQAPLVIKAKVSAPEIAKVQVCQEKRVSDCGAGQVQMRVSAYPYPDYGTLRGKVVSISADAIAPESELAYYEVTIQPERSYLERQNHRYPIQSGMELTAEIVSNQETVLAFLLRKSRLILHS